MRMFDDAGAGEVVCTLTPPVSATNIDVARRHQQLLFDLVAADHYADRFVLHPPPRTGRLNGRLVGFSL